MPDRFGARLTLGHSPTRNRTVNAIQAPLTEKPGHSLENWSFVEPGPDAALIVTGGVCNELQFVGVPISGAAMGRDNALRQRIATALRDLSAGHTGSIDAVARTCAFVVIDTANLRMHVFRDALGLCPLFYYHNSQEIVAGNSQLLTAHFAGLSFRPEPVALSGFLECAGMDPLSEYSAVKGLRQVRAGTCVTIESGEPVCRTHWRPWERPLKTFTNDNELIEHVRQLLRQSVAAFLTPGVTWLDISGGIDSTAIAVIAKELVASGAAGGSSLC